MALQTRGRFRGCKRGGCPAWGERLPLERRPQRNPRLPKARRHPFCGITTTVALLVTRGDFRRVDYYRVSCSPSANFLVACRYSGRRDRAPAVKTDSRPAVKRKHRRDHLSTDRREVISGVLSIRPLPRASCGGGRNAEASVRSGLAGAQLPCHCHWFPPTTGGAIPA